MQQKIIIKYGIQKTIISYYDKEVYSQDIKVCEIDLDGEGSIYIEISISDFSQMIWKKMNNTRLDITLNGFKLNNRIPLNLLICKMEVPNN